MAETGPQTVSGSVSGKIHASGRLEILSTGRVWGDVEVGSFLLDEEGYPGFLRRIFAAALARRAERGRAPVRNA